MDLTRVSKTGSRNWMAYSPTRPMIPARTGSDRRRCSMASFIVKHSCGGARHRHCTGMRTFAVFTVCAAAVAVAQDLPTIKVDVDIVNVLASVRDKHGALVPNLQKADFTVLEDGKPQDIKYFVKETDVPLTIGLLVDVSGSQRNVLEVERRAAAEFFGQVLRKKDMAFLISFGTETELMQDYTNSTRLLQAALNQLQVQSGVGGLHPGPVPTSGAPRG